MNFRYTVDLALYFCSFLALITPINSNAKNLDVDTLRNFKQKVEASIKQFENTKREKWSHKVIRFENEEGDITSSIEVFTPHKDKSKQWSLLELNGKVPTKRQLKKFIKRKLKSTEKEDPEGANHSVRLREIVDIDSLSVAHENDTHVEMMFNVHIEKLGDSAKGKLEGTLTYDKKHDYIDTITIVNNSDFSPMFSASISDFSLTFKFKKIGSAILPLENTLDMKGTFAFFTDIDETSVDRFSEYSFKAKD